MANRDSLKNAVSASMFLATIAVFAFWGLPEETEQALVKLKSLWGHSDDVPLHSYSEGGNQNKVTASSLPKAKGVAEKNAHASLEKFLGPDLESDLLLDSSPLSLKKDGARGGQAVLDALTEIENWTPSEGGYDAHRLKLFLRYPKLWVRVSAYAFALKAKIVKPDEAEKLAQFIRAEYRQNVSQLSRFLTRYERKDHELFEQLKRRLVLPESSVPKDVPTPEVEEDNADAS